MKSPLHFGKTSITTLRPESSFANFEEAFFIIEKASYVLENLIENILQFTVVQLISHQIRGFSEFSLYLVSQQGVDVSRRRWPTFSCSCSFCRSELFLQFRFIVYKQWWNSSHASSFFLLKQRKSCWQSKKYIEILSFEINMNSEQKSLFSFL